GIVQPLPVSPPFPSECFSHTVLVAVPTLFLFVLLPVLYVQIKTSRAKPLPWTTLQSMKWILVLMLMNSSRRAGLSNPGAIFCIWLVFLICGAPEFYAWITIGSDPSHFEYTDTHPETSASFPNRQLLCWFGPLVSKAYRKPLEINDLFELDDGLKSDTLMEQWEGEWRKSMKDYEKRKQAQALSSSENSYTEKSPLLLGNGKNYGTQKETNYLDDRVELPSIVGVMWRLFKWELIGGSAIKFLSDVIQFANPAFL
ncbi:hypothetical protein OSTOST_23914, partial [Ostertagia ostertagi]